MKWILFFLFFLPIFSMAAALKSPADKGSIIISKKSFTQDGELNLGYFATCSGSRLNECYALCSEAICLIAIDSCDSCITSQNLNIFALFKDFSKLFVLSPSDISWSLTFEKLVANEWRVLDENTILNLFEDTQSEEKYLQVKAQFLSSCPAGSDKSFLIVDMDLVPVLYICQGSYGQKIYQTQLNPEFSP